jgi:hypothetical protein
LATGVPVTENDSLLARPLYDGVPDSVAVVVRSYTLSTPETPVMVSVFADTELETVAIFTVVAPELVKAIFPEYGEPDTVAVGSKRT